MRKILTSATLTVVFLIAGDAFAQSKAFLKRVSYVPSGLSAQRGLGNYGAVKVTLGAGSDSKDFTLCTIKARATTCYGKSLYSEAALLSIHAALLKVLGTDISVWLEADGTLGIGQQK